MYYLVKKYDKRYLFLTDKNIYQYKSHWWVFRFDWARSFDTRELAEEKLNKLIVNNLELKDITKVVNYKQAKNIQKINRENFA